MTTNDSEADPALVDANYWRPQIHREWAPGRVACKETSTGEIVYVTEADAQRMGWRSETFRMVL